MKVPFFPVLRLLGTWSTAILRYIKSVILPKGLLYRFILIILLPLILLQTIVGFFFYDRHWSTLSRRLSYDIVGEIETVAFLIETHDFSDAQLDDFFRAMKKNLTLDMHYLPFKTLADFGLTPLKQVSETLPAALVSLPYPTAMTKTNNRQQIAWVQLSDGVLKTIVPRKRFFSSTVYVFLLWMIGSSFLLFWIAFLFMKNQVRSIERLSKAAELFGMGHDLSGFKPEGATEVKQAGFSFILMKNRIQRYLTERTGMLAGVSHDLRTPLTRMKLQLSMMPQNEIISDLQTDVLEMEQMLNGYLNFARGAGQEKMQEINLNALVTGLVEKATRAGQKIDFHAEQQIVVFGRPGDLSRAITNIITNAGRYAKRTQIQLGIRQKMIALIIDDNGPGIPKDKRREVFKAFYRLDASRNSQTGGVGLGMTITRDIILSHGGEITLHTSPQRGLRVVICLPI